MHTHHRFVFGILVACAAGALGVATSAAQRPSTSAPAQTAQAGSQASTLTGCVEYGPGNTYVLATEKMPSQPDLANESDLEHQELAAAEHSYQLTLPPTGLSQLVGAKVRAAGTLSRVEAPVSTAAGRGRGLPSAPPMIDELHVTSMQKLAEFCDPQLTMFAM